MNYIYIIYIIFFAALATHLKLTQYCKSTLQLKEKPLWDFPGGPVVKTAARARGAGLILGQGTKILHAAWYGQKRK